MWLLYGMSILLSGIDRFLLCDSVWITALLIGGVIIPLPLMVWYHHRLMRQYKKQK